MYCDVVAIATKDIAVIAISIVTLYITVAIANNIITWKPCIKWIIVR